MNFVVADLMARLIFNFPSRQRPSKKLLTFPSLCYALLEMESFGLTSFRALPITFIPRDFAAWLIQEIYRLYQIQWITF